MTLVDRPQSYEDLAARSGFVAPLDHEQHKLKAVLTDYHFSKQAPCGLKGCRQPHNHGFLVSTESGAETNVGKDCGRNFFGDEVFATAHSAYEARRQRADLIARMKALQGEADSIIARAKAPVFRDYGGKWARKVQSALEAVIGTALVQSLGIAHLRGELGVNRVTERSDEEIKEARALDPSLTWERARYVSESLGTLEPMPWIDYDFPGRLLQPFVEDLRPLLVLDPEQTPTPLLKKKLKPFERMTSEIEMAEAACSTVLRFLDARNLELVALWLPDHYSKQAQALRDWIGSAKYQALMTGKGG